jgi:two-component system sensor histidine kinase BaeS
VRVDVTGSDEFADIGLSVNRMAEDLERSSQLDQQFLRSVSNDLRTPLTSITGYAEALIDV